MAMLLLQQIISIDAWLLIKFLAMRTLNNDRVFTNEGLKMNVLNRK